VEELIRRLAVDANGGLADGTVTMRFVFAELLDFMLETCDDDRMGRSVGARYANA
jgi:hypothetical protein